MGVGRVSMKKDNLHKRYTPNVNITTFYYNVPITSYEEAIAMLEQVYIHDKEMEEISLNFIGEHLDKTREFMKESNLFHVQYDQGTLMSVLGPLGIKIQLALNDSWGKMQKQEGT